MPRERQVMVAGALVILLVVCVRSIPAAVRRSSLQRARVTALADQLDAAKQAISAEPDFRERFKSSAHRLISLAPRLMPASSMTEAAASLTTLVMRAAERAKVRVGSMQSQVDTSSSVFPAIIIRVDANTDIRGLVQWLGALEEGRPPVSVSELVVTPQEPMASSDRPEILRVQVVLRIWVSPRRSEQDSQ